MPPVNPTGIATEELLSQLVYELLDAHVDTQQLAAELDPGPAWEAHLDYLSNLQRVGREILAGVQARNG